MKTENNRFIEIFEGSDQFYLADPSKITIKKNGGERWETKKQFHLPLTHCLEGHLEGTLAKGVVLPPIRKSDNKCKWGAIDIDGQIYSDNKFKIQLLDKIEELNLPLTACFSKSRGLHLYIKFIKWTDASTIINILKTFLKKLNLPEDTEIFPKQSKLGPTDTGNGIMLPYMKNIGNDWIKEYGNDYFSTGTLQEFLEHIEGKKIDAEEIEIDLPKAKEIVTEENNKEKKKSVDPESRTKWDILNGIKTNTIDQHPTMGGKYHSWIQVVIAKAIDQGYGDNEILNMIEAVHEDGRGIGYVFPESYQKQINHGRKKFNKKNPGVTNFLKGRTIESLMKYDEIKNKYCYVMANDMYNQIGSPEFYQGMQINNYHAHELFIKKGTLTQAFLKDKNFKKAETFITNPKYPPGLVDIKKAGEIPLVNKGTVLNIYIPNYIIPKKGDVSFIIKFFGWLIGEKKWIIIEQWIAFMVQFPGEKMKWALVLVSVIEGVGKGLLARICSRIMGYHNVNENANYKHLTNNHNTLLIGKQLLFLNEVSLGDFKSKAEGTNTLKNFVADDYYSCNFKNKPMVTLPNLTNFGILSNDERVLGAPKGGRRYFFCNIKKTEDDIIEQEEFYQKAWDYADSDEGASALLYYFKHEVKIEDPSIFKKRAPKTDDLLELIEQSKHPVQKKLEYDLNRPDIINRKIFGHDFSGLVTFDWLNEALNTRKSNHIHDNFDWGSFGDDALYKFLADNCIKWNNGDNTRQIEINGVRHRFYNLDDSRCPIPNKSYKDLKQKDIETIWTKYRRLSNEITKEEGEYIEALEVIDGKIEEFKKRIKEEASDKTSHFKKELQGKTIDEIYEKVMSGEIKFPNKYLLDPLQEIKSLQQIIAKGIRTPETILEAFKNE